MDIKIGDQKVPCMIDSGSMVNVILSQMAINLGLGVVKLDIPMRGAGGEKYNIKGVGEN